MVGAGLEGLIFDAPVYSLAEGERRSPSAGATQTEKRRCGPAGRWSAVPTGQALSRLRPGPFMQWAPTKRRAQVSVPQE
jgi:hypothetical protein